jgi:hypothetical protein
MNLILSYSFFCLILFVLRVVLYDTILFVQYISDPITCSNSAFTVTHRHIYVYMFLRNFYLYFLWKISFMCFVINLNHK